MIGGGSALIRVANKIWLCLVLSWKVLLFEIDAPPHEDKNYYGNCLYRNQGDEQRRRNTADIGAVATATLEKNIAKSLIEGISPLALRTWTVNLLIIGRRRTRVVLATRAPLTTAPSRHRAQHPPAVEQRELPGLPWEDCPLSGAYCCQLRHRPPLVEE